MSITHESHCAALGREIEQFVNIVRGADMSAKVPACPEWDLAELVRHMGRVYRWCDHIVTTRAERYVPPERIEFDLPADSARLVEWLAASGSMVLDALASSSPDQPVWSWGADKSVAFWSRRMLHETIVHRYDAAIATDQSFEVETEIAVDGVSELNENLPSVTRFSPKLRELSGLGEVVRYAALDTNRAWDVKIEQTGIVPGFARGEADVLVAGRAVDLLLFAWGRIPPTDRRLTVTGDRALLERWIEHTRI